MACVLPVAADDDSALVWSPLVRTLAALPDEWTLLLGPCRGEVSAVLVHAEIGVAVLEDVPRDASPGHATFCRFLERERFFDYFPGDLPVVALGATAESPTTIGEQLAAAFDVAPRLSIRDSDWAYALIELILQSDRLDVPPREEVVEAPDAERVFRSLHAVEALGVSVTAASIADAAAEGDLLPRNDVPPPDKVWLLPAVPLRSLGVSRRLSSLPPRARTMAATWSGLIGAIGAMAWVFSYDLQHALGLDAAPQAEVIMTAASPPFSAAPKTAASASLPVPESTERVATAAQAVPAFETPAPRRTAKPAEIRGAKRDTISRAKRAPSPEAASHATPGRSAEGAAASGAVQRSARSSARPAQCADWLHQSRPGGSDYDGPPIAQCSRRR
jgi:hypothetical protein